MSQFNTLRNATAPDQIYYDVTVTNFEDRTKPPNKFYYNERREVPFVENPEDYYLTIARFTCETNSLPVFIPTIASCLEQQGEDKSTWQNADPNMTIYSVTLQLVDRTTDPVKYGDYITVPIIWKPQDQSAPIPSFLPSGYQDNTGGYYNCTSFAYLTYLIQEALNTSFIMLDNTLTSRGITNPASMPPTLAWDCTSNKAYFVVETKGYVMGGGLVQSVSGSGQNPQPYLRNFSVANSDNFTQSTAMDIFQDYETWLTNKVRVANGLPKIGGSFLGFLQGIGSAIVSTFNSGVSAVKKLVSGNVGGAIKDAGKAVVSASTIVPNPVLQIAGGVLGRSLEGTGESISDVDGSSTVPGSATLPRNIIKISRPSSKPPSYPKDNYAGANRVVEVFFNAPLFQLFNSFPAFGNGVNTQLATGQRNYRLIFANMNGVGESSITPTYAKNSGVSTAVTTLYQEYSTVSSISPISSVVFCSNTLPIVPNLVSTPLIYNNSQQISKQGVDSAFANIITDLSSEDGNYRPYLIYLPTAQYRYITLRGNQPLYNMDLTIYYRTKFGEMIPFTLSSGASVTLKLAFIKKSTIVEKL